MLSRINEKDGKMKALKEKLKKGEAAYKDAHTFAIESGSMLSEAFLNNLSSDVLPDGKLYYNIADRVIRPMMEKNFELISENTMEIQTILNKQANVGIRAISPEINQDKIQGIIDLVSGKENFDDIAYMLEEPIVNFSQSVDILLILGLSPALC